MKFKDDSVELKLAYDDVLIAPRYSEVSSRSAVDTSVSFGETKLQLPIISSNMDTITGPKMAEKLGELGALGLIHRYMSVEEHLAIMGDWDYDLGPVAVSVGTHTRDKERIDATLEYALRRPVQDVVICVDIAHGDSLHMVETVKYIRDKGWHGTLMAGATCTYEGTKRLLDAGADIIRVGVGPGSACTTRVKTGCGYPQLSAVLECAQAGPIIADGGIRTPGDAAKALAAGAKAVMIGGMLAGTDCVPNWDIAMESYQKHLGFSSGVGTHPPSISFRGMASAEARKAFGAAPVNAEGVSCTVKAKPEGSTVETITHLEEGIRSAMSYTNSHNLNEFLENAQFIRVSTAVAQENVPHILNEAKPTWRN